MRDFSSGSQQGRVAHGSTVREPRCGRFSSSRVTPPAGERFGLPAVLSVNGEPHVAVVQPALPEEGEGELPRTEPFQVPPEAPAAEGAPAGLDAGGVAPAPGP
jgi:hypothetical protein